MLYHFYLSCLHIVVYYNLIYLIFRMVCLKAMMIAAAAESAPVVSGGGTAPVVSAVEAAPVVATGKTAPVVSAGKNNPEVI
jgi:hypothetical protein